MRQSQWSLWWIPKKMRFLPLAAINSQELLSWGGGSGPLPFSCWHSDWLILYRSCAGHHSGGEFMGAVPFLNPLSNPLSNVFIFGKVLRILGCTIKYWPQLAFLSLLCVLVFARTSKNNINEGIILSHSVTCLSVVVLRRAWQSRAAHMGDVRQRIEKRPGHGRASNIFL